MAGAVPLNPKFKFTDANGDPLAMGWLTVFLAGTSTLANTYTDQAQTIPNTNPVHLDANGEATLWTNPALRYKWLLQAPDPITGLPGVTVPGWPVDNIPGGASDTMATDLAGTGGAGMIGFAAGFPGSVLQTVEAVLREVVSVKRFGAVGDGIANDTAAVAAAVAHASSGRDLFWPAGTYLTTVNIPGFHSVRHLGAGIVKRGTDLFYVEPRSAQANTLYITPTGSAGNDGLSVAQPMATFQNAFDALANYGPVLDGTWTVAAAAGTYTISAGSHNLTTPSKNMVVVRGPAVGGTPNVPTCIVDGGGVQANFAHGLNAIGLGVKVEFREIKAQNFKSAGNTRVGLVADHASEVFWNNCHSLDCSWTGGMAKECERAVATGGIWDCGTVGAYGFLSDSTRTSFGSGATSTANGPSVKNAISAGVYWSTGSQGHCDYVTFEDCGVAFLCAENSRADTVGNNYKRNTVAKRAITGGIFASGGATEVFNDGTADANGTNIEYKAFSGDISELDDQGSGSWQRVVFDRANHALTGVTPTTLSTPYTIKANRLKGIGKACRVHGFGVFTQVTNGAVLNVLFGGMTVALAIPLAATNVAFEVDCMLFEVAGGYRGFGKLSQGLSSQRLGSASAGFTSTADQTISVSATLANAADSMNLYRVDVYLIG